MLDAPRHLSGQKVGNGECDRIAAAQHEKTRRLGGFQLSGIDGRVSADEIDGALPRELMPGLQRHWQNYALHHHEQKRADARHADQSFGR